MGLGASTRTSCVVGIREFCDENKIVFVDLPKSNPFTRDCWWNELESLVRGL